MSFFNNVRMTNIRKISLFRYLRGFLSVKNPAKSVIKYILKVYLSAFFCYSNPINTTLCPQKGGKS
jgi:hypothetical protein